MRRLLPLAALLVLAPSRAWGHPIDLASLELISQGEVVQARLECALPVALEAARIPAGTDLSPAGMERAIPALFAATLGSGALRVEGRPCRWGAPVGSLEGIRIQISAAARCEVAPGSLELTLPFVDERGPTFRIVGDANLQGMRLPFQAGPGRQTVLLQGPEPSPGDALVRGFGLPLRSPYAALAVLLLFAVPLGAPRREGLLGAAAALGGLGVGVGLAHAGMAIAPAMLRLGAGLAVAVALLDPLLRRLGTMRVAQGAFAGPVLGLGLASARVTSMELAALAIALGLAAGVAMIALPHLGARAARPVAVVLALLVVAATLFL